MEYLITYMTSNTMVIEADSEEDARDKFFDPENFSYACEAINDNPIEIADVQEYEQ